MTAAPVRHDRLRARLVELDSIGRVLARAAGTVADGWVQDDWSTGDGTCLVESVRVHSAGQLRARTLDVVWHARYGDAPGASAGFGRVPPPAVRLARIRDLTRWNDARTRHRGEVLALLADTAALAEGEVARVRGLLGLRVVVSVPVPSGAGLRP